MTTQITNKQVKVITDTNFNNNEIINAKIDTAKNTLIGILTELVAGNGITITNNNVISLKGTQQLTDGTDIDTIKTEGNYFIKSPISTLGLPILPTYTKVSNENIAYWICLLLIEKEYGFGTNIVRQTITLTPIAPPMTIISSETLMFTRTLCDNYTYVDTSWTKIDGDMTNITVNNSGSSNRDINISKLNANYCYLCQYMTNIIDEQIVHYFDSITSLTLTNIEDTPDEIRVMFKAGSSFTLTAAQLKVLNLDNIVFEQDKVYIITIKNLYATIDTEGKNPNIPTVNDATITITQGGVTKGTFTVNQSSNTTIALDAGGSSYTAGGGLYIDNNEIGMNRNTAFYNHLYINSKDENIQDSDISFDESTFFTYTGGADNNFYNFIYMNNTWNLRVRDYSTDPWGWNYIGEVDLADYGITYSGVPFENGWFILAGNYLTGKTNFTVVRLSFSNVFLNGILLTEDLDFTRIGNTITFINYTLKSTDRIQVI